MHGAGVPWCRVVSVCTGSDRGRGSPHTEPSSPTGQSLCLLCDRWPHESERPLFWSVSEPSRFPKKKRSETAVFKVKTPDQEQDWYIRQLNIFLELSSLCYLVWRLSWQGLPVSTMLAKQPPLIPLETIRTAGQRSSHACTISTIVYRIPWPFWMLPCSLAGVAAGRRRRRRTDVDHLKRRQTTPRAAGPSGSGAPRARWSRGHRVER